ncbi:unnamed protein product [Strongylus vulgaris]|uniref:Uncharacterized protein n=1 Tax=Strongylus vulgaris TaxID=40348 RepID=A0A3P7K295_STRVU|nr:unnamed protein product [Strongylus vulgaris]
MNSRPDIMTEFNPTQHARNRNMIQILIFDATLEDLFAMGVNLERSLDALGFRSTISELPVPPAITDNSPLSSHDSFDLKVSKKTLVQIKPTFAQMCNGYAVLPETTHQQDTLLQEQFIEERDENDQLSVSKTSFLREQKVCNNKVLCAILTRLMVPTLVDGHYLQDECFRIYLDTLMSNSDAL